MQFLLPQHVSGHTWPHPPSSVHSKKAQCSTTQAAFQVWPPKRGRHPLIVLLMMGILVPETCWGNKNCKTAYFVASIRFFTFTMSTMHGHMNIKQSLRFWHRITHCNSTPYLEVTYRKQQQRNEAVFSLCSYFSVSSIETCCGYRAIHVGCDDWCVRSHQQPFVLRTSLISTLSETSFLLFVRH
jgi:hypothetical protein